MALEKLQAMAEETNRNEGTSGQVKRFPVYEQHQRKGKKITLNPPINRRKLFSTMNGYLIFLFFLFAKLWQNIIL
ncbi:MAG: hypothetical protein J7K02_12520 [Deltaproteobacteria bacterium]|nr:hypothetical protein [Deltaproteobacteria bacterium]